MLDPLFESLGGVSSGCLLLFVIAMLISLVALIVGLARGWIVWGATHDEVLEQKQLAHAETVEQLNFYRKTAFEFAALAEAASHE